VQCRQDKVFPLALQQLFVAEIDAVSSRQTVVRQLETSHSPFLSQPAELALVIASAHQLAAR
jgi:hypothetical protein